MRRYTEASPRATAVLGRLSAAGEGRDAQEVADTCSLTVRRMRSLERPGVARLAGARAGCHVQAERCRSFVEGQLQAPMTRSRRTAARRAVGRSVTDSRGNPAGRSRRQRVTRDGVMPPAGAQRAIHRVERPPAPSRSAAETGPVRAPRRPWAGRDRVERRQGAPRGQPDGGSMPTAWRPPRPPGGRRGRLRSEPG